MHARNTGAFLNLGAGLSANLRFWIFNVAVSAFLIGVAWMLLRKPVRLQMLMGLTLILGGGIGNLIVTVGSFHTGIFNIADFAIVIGVGLVVFSAPRERTATA